ERICLTGPNGCGKSTVMAQIYHAIDPEILPIAVDEDREANALILVQYGLGAQNVYLARNGVALGAEGSKFSWFSDDIENAPGWNGFLEKGMGFHEFDDQFSDFAVNQDESLSAPDAATAWMSPAMDLIHSKPADDLREMVDDLSSDRTQRFNRFLKHPDNRDETVATVEELFEESYPDPLAEIAKSWEPILAPANIRFSRSHPVGLISGRTGESIPFSSLSPGFQRYLLRTGHLRSLGMSNPYNRSFFVIDDLENGLSEAIADSLLADCLNQVHGDEAQIFVSTLNPNVSAQFEDHEVFHLAFDETNGINIERHFPTPIEHESEEPELPAAATARTERPNTIKVARLRREIQETEDQDELADLIDELMSIRDR
ncbi:MAG: AAA family ATPase, partial [Verrucomicrobiota bacterium]